MKSTKTTGEIKTQAGMKRASLEKMQACESPRWMKPSAVMVTMILLIIFIVVSPLLMLVYGTSATNAANAMGVEQATPVPLELVYPQSSYSTSSVIKLDESADAITSEPEEELAAEEIVEMCMGDNIISTDLGTLKRYDLPDVFYPDLDFSSFQAYMSWRMITDPSTEAYKVISDDRMYVDENGMCRFKTTDDQFTIDGQDDYVIALGTYYKEKGTCGSRWLVVTSTGSYTAITGDEKANCDTDVHNMLVFRKDGTSTGIIEWIVDYDLLHEDIALHGTVTRGPVEAARGEILYMYRID